MSNLLVFIALFLMRINAQNCSTTIFPMESDIIICDNLCDYCTIICDDINQCRFVNIYSGALNTSIYCFGEGSCGNMNIYAGNNFDNYPIGYISDNFTRLNYDSVNIICTGKVSCLGLNVYVDGSYIDGGMLDAGDDVEGFKDGYLKISILETQIFNLFCGLDTKNCNGAQYRCDNGNCQCNGVTRGVNDGCAALIGYFIWNS